MSEFEEMLRIECSKTSECEGGLADTICAIKNNRVSVGEWDGLLRSKDLPMDVNEIESECGILRKKVILTVVSGSVESIW